MIRDLQKKCGLFLQDRPHSNGGQKGEGGHPNNVLSEILRVSRDKLDNKKGGPSLEIDRPQSKICEALD